MIPIQLTKGR